MTEEQLWQEYGRHAEGFKKLEVLLPDNEFSLLHDNAKIQGLTKAEYIASLLHGNALSTDKPKTKARAECDCCKKCGFCNKPFIPFRSTTKFCCDNCRKKNHIKKQKS